MMMMAVDYSLSGPKGIELELCIQHSRLIGKYKPIMVENNHIESYRKMMDIVVSNYNHFACDQVWAWHRMNVFPLRQILQEINIPFHFIHIPVLEKDVLHLYAQDKNIHPLEAISLEGP
jgi:hypothetical protein